MRWPDVVRPVRMSRVVVVAPQARLRAALVVVAEEGVVELEMPLDRQGEPGPAEAALARAGGGAARRCPVLSRDAPDLEALVRTGRWDLVAGEVELEHQASHALTHGPAAVVVGWIPASAQAVLAERLGTVGASVVDLPHPRTADVPTLVRAGTVSRPFRPLVDTYGVVPYADVDPTLFAGFSYVLMFGMMFGDVGHGLLLAGLALLLGRSRRPALAALRAYWGLPFAAGLAGALFGLLYGEAFGPTGLVAVSWLAPMDQPLRLLVVAVGVGAVLMGASYVLGIVNRWREGGPAAALFASSGIAGASLYLGAAGAVLALAWHRRSVAFAAFGLAGLGLLLLFTGLLARSGGGGATLIQASVETFDAVVRVGANAISFARLAAFGLTHATIGWVVWQGTVGLWGPGLQAVGAALLFVLGNAAAFALEGLVVGVQALRLEYYELFSRILTGEGRPFVPWHLPIEPAVKEDA